METPRCGVNGKGAARQLARVRVRRLVIRGVMRGTVRVTANSGTIDAFLRSQRLQVRHDGSGRATSFDVVERNAALWPLFASNRHERQHFTRRARRLQ
jgi:hypothetical protein